MTPTEARRHEPRTGPGDVLAEGQVTTLTGSLPPVDWREQATKSDLKGDLAALEDRMKATIDTGLTAVNAKIDSGLAKQTYVVLAGVAAALVAPIYLALFAGFGG